MSKYTKINKNFANSSKMRQKSLNKIKNSPKYIQNQKQIECIKKVLIECADVPPKLIDWLIEAVQENISLEYQVCKNSKF